MAAHPAPETTAGKRAARNISDGWNSVPKIGLLAALGALLVACGQGDDANGPQNRLRTSQIVLEAEEAALEQAVRVDSVFWDLDFIDPLDPEDVIVEGHFGLFVRNRAQEALTIRYELRFFDDDFFLVDRFIPFGQPLILEAGQLRTVTDTFTIRAGPIRELPLINLMQVAGTIQRPTQ